MLSIAVPLAGALAVVFVSWNRDGVPEADALDDVYATMPEVVDVRSLSAGVTLGRLLEDAGMRGTDRNSLLLAFREQANPRRMRSGAEVRIVRRRWGEDPLRIEVDLDRDRLVRLERARSGWTSSLIELMTTTDTVFVAGEIRSSLWTAILGNGGLGGVPLADRRQMVGQLDRVFQWQIDFSRQIRDGDTYRFVLERERRTDGSMRSGRLLAAELVNAGRAYHAIRFEPRDEPQSWFDLEGQSVRRAFLMKPIELSRISSGFTNSRFHPILRRWRAHRGVDYAANSGTPVQATGSGVVVRRGWGEAYGRVIDLRHPNGFLTRYAHLGGWARGLVVGSRVTQGEVIGYVGMTGLATGPHLHYEMHVGGRPIDPIAIDLPAEDPVPEADMARWERVRDERLRLLLGLPGPETFRERRTEARVADSDG